MTLNITMLTQQYVYQSADHRLWDPGADALVTDASNKTVLVRGWEWQGTVTYTGVGRWRSLDTSQWLVRWLTGQPDATFEDIVEFVRRSGSDWLEDIRRGSHRTWPHTFIVAAFVGESATAAVISNFESVGQRPLSQPARELAVSTVSCNEDPVVITTGCVTPVVSRQQRQVLERLGRAHPHDSARIRQAIQDLNRRAAAVGGRACPISDDCFVRSFDRFGQGHESGSALGAEPHEVFEGENMGALLKDAMAQIFPDGKYQLVGSTYTTSAAAAAPSLVCEPSLSSMPSSPKYAITDLAQATGLNAAASAVAADGRVVGNSSRIPRGPSLPAYWPRGGETVFLPDLGGLTGRASSINDSGLIVGEVEDTDRRLHACRWDETMRFSLLPVEGARHSGALRVDAAGNVVGWASFHPTEGGQSHYRPVIWPDGAEPRVVRELPGEWGQAIDINARGDVLISAYEGQRAFPLLWRDGDVLPLVRPGEYLISVGLDDSGRVLAWTRGQDGKAVALTWRQDDGWKQLGTPADWYVTRISPGGYIAGHVDLDGWRRPWLLVPGEDRAVLLSHFSYHDSTISDVVDGGRACGSASTDHGYHPIRWDPVPAGN